MSVISCKEAYGRGPSSAASEAAAASLSLSSGSHAIAKRKQKHPKIRIVHIFAPKVIKTEAHNFRALVQSLTGKPQAQAPGRSNQLLRRRINNNIKKKQMQQQQKTTSVLSSPPPPPDSESGLENSIRWEDIKIEPRVVEEEEVEVEEEEEKEMEMMMMMTSRSSSSSIGRISSSGGLLEVLGDLELGFLHGFCDLPWPPSMLPMASSSHIDV